MYYPCEVITLRLQHYNSFTDGNVLHFAQDLKPLSQLQGRGAETLRFLTGVF